VALIGRVVVTEEFMHFKNNRWIKDAPAIIEYK